MIDMAPCATLASASTIVALVPPIWDRGVPNAANNKRSIASLAFVVNGATMELSVAPGDNHDQERLCCCRRGPGFDCNGVCRGCRAGQRWRVALQLLQS